MTKKLKWRLSSLPTPSELRELVKDKIITQEEARDILFKLEDYHNCDKCKTEWIGDIDKCPNCEDIDKRDKKSLESEIKFLRELVSKLGAASTTKIVETIKYIEKPYKTYPWYTPYYNWYVATDNIYLCNGTSAPTLNTNCVTSGYSDATNLGSVQGSSYTTTVSGDFTSIKTF